MSRRQNSSSTLTIAVVAAIVFAVDQVSKRWVMSHMPAVCQKLPDTSQGCSFVKSVLPDNLLNWTFEPNTHGAFGFFGSNITILIALAVLVLVLFWYMFQESAQRSLMVRIAFGMIVGGAIGNIADRFIHNYVVDFIDFRRIWIFIFNIADASITSGVILLMLSGLVTRRRA